MAALVYGLMEKHPHVQAQLLIGEDRRSTNPKLNNVLKGWDAARHPWIIMADSNVLMPRDYIQQLMGRWREDTGLVCSMPIGARPGNFWADAGMRLPQHLPGALAICRRVARPGVRSGQEHAVPP